MSWVPKVLTRVWSEESGMSLLLGLLVVLIFVVYPLAPISLGSPHGALVYSLLLVSGVAALGGTHRWMGRVAALLAVGWILVEILIAAIPSKNLYVVEAATALMALVFLEMTILVQVFRPGRITVHRIEGAVAVYLLIGLSWAWLYALILLLDPTAMSASGTQEQNLIQGTNLLYYSFVTLTTVGYGDIVPVHPLARSFSNLEALYGQLYPAILIGRLVSLGIGEHREGQNPLGPDGGSEA